MNQQTFKFIILAFVLVCFGLLPVAQAVSPTPDGGYANANTAEGSNALFSLTTGVRNTANGYLALFFDTAGRYNTAAGSEALYNNTAGNANTAIGTQALYKNHFTNASGNTAIGYQALYSNTSAGGSTAIGYQALFSNIYVSGSTGIGYQALYHNVIAGSNTAIGYQALFWNGWTDNQYLPSGNTATGYKALFNNRSGENNTADGGYALVSESAGDENTAIGFGALQNDTGGSENIALGAFAGLAVTTANGVISIGSSGKNVDGTCFIGSIRGVTTQNADAIPVLIDSAGQLGTASSSRQYKTDIKPMDKASESILALKPVSFRYKVHKHGTPQFGLIAEEVAEVNPNLVIYDAEGKPYTVRYDAVNAMLLNEFLKEHRKVEELQAARIAERKEIAELKQLLKMQAAAIQKVSDQLELSKPAPQTVVNNQ